MGNMVFEGRKEKSGGKEKKIVNDELYHKQPYVSSYKKHNESSYLMTRWKLFFDWQKALYSLPERREHLTSASYFLLFFIIFYI